MSGGGRGADWLPARFTNDVDEVPSRKGLAMVPGLAQLSHKLSSKANDGSAVGKVVAEARAFFLDTKLNLLLLALPFAFISRFAGWGDAATFVLSCVALTPLAERLGFVTEQLAMYTNDALGGLLNASFGNATEVIIAGFALAKGGVTYLRVVQLSLLGSIVSNLLLVMGCAFIAGGIKQKSQSFGQAGINVNCGMLILATFAVVLASLLDATQTERNDGHSELALSRFMSICMVLCYGVYLLFQLKTHRHLFEEQEEEAPTPSTAAPAPKPAGLGLGAGVGAIIGGIPISRRPSGNGNGLPPATIAGGGGGGSTSGNGGGGSAGNSVRGGTRGLEGGGGGEGGGAGGLGSRGPGLPGDIESAERMRIPEEEDLGMISGGESPRDGYPTAKGAHELELGLVRGGGSKRGMVAGEGERQPLVPQGPSSSSMRARDAGRTSSGRSIGSEARGGPRGVPILSTNSDDGSADSKEGGGGDDDEEELVLSKAGCFIWLTIVTIFIAFLSEFITDAITGASSSLGIPLPFLTTILLPIVGNAAEHASALIFAYKNRMEIALGVAVGSSTQVSMMVVPFCVLLAWTMGQPLDLDFNAFEAFVLFGSVLLAVIVLQDGQANYLKGVLLCLTYFFISAGFWCHKDVDLTGLQEGEGGGER